MLNTKQMFELESLVLERIFPLHSQLDDELTRTIYTIATQSAIITIQEYEKLNERASMPDKIPTNPVGEIYEIKKQQGK